jgi:two-component system phosphate regulon sensor histidine kinase PhoR
MVRDDMTDRAHGAAMARSFLDAVPLPAVLIGPDERIDALNPPGAELFGGVSVVGRHYVTVIRQPQLTEAVDRALRGGERIRTRYLRSIGEREETFRVVASPVAGPRGPGVVMTFEDVTDLQRAGEMRRDFVANVSHELKTPLTAMLGFIETLRGAAKNDPAAQERFLGIMAKEGERMNRLVSDLLSLSRVEGDERVRPTAPVEMSRLICSTLRALRPMAEAAGVSLEALGCGDSQDMAEASRIAGDADQLQQVLTNLIENAIKYGGAGGVVTVALSLHDTGQGFPDGFVQVDVIDRGEGFDPIHIPRLTERFYRVDNHRSRALGGTGLGLAIAKHILNRHRGRLRIDTKPGQGARFSVLLPRQR